MAFTTTAPAAPVWPIGRRIRRGWVVGTLRQRWSRLAALPDRGAAAKADPLPPEFFRYPPI